MKGTLGVTIGVLAPYMQFLHEAGQVVMWVLGASLVLISIYERFQQVKINKKQLEK